MEPAVGILGVTRTGVVEKGESKKEGFRKEGEARTTVLVTAPDAGWMLLVIMVVSPLPPLTRTWKLA